MDVGVWKALAGELNKSFHEVVIFFASYATFSEAKVKIVIK